MKLVYTAIALLASAFVAVCGLIAINMGASTGLVIGISVGVLSTAGIVMATHKWKHWPTVGKWTTAILIAGLIWWYLGIGVLLLLTALVVTGLLVKRYWATLWPWLQTIWGRYSATKLLKGLGIALLVGLLLGVGYCTFTSTDETSSPPTETAEAPAEAPTNSTTTNTPPGNAETIRTCVEWKKQTAEELEEKKDPTCNEWKILKNGTGPTRKCDKGGWWQTEDRAIQQCILWEEEEKTPYKPTDSNSTDDAEESFPGSVNQGEGHTPPTSGWYIFLYIVVGILGFVAVIIATEARETFGKTVKPGERFAQFLLGLGGAATAMLFIAMCWSISQIYTSITHWEPYILSSPGILGATAALWSIFPIGTMIKGFIKTLFVKNKEKEILSAASTIAKMGPIVTTVLIFFPSLALEIYFRVDNGSGALVHGQMAFTTLAFVSHLGLYALCWGVLVAEEAKDAAWVQATWVACFMIMAVALTLVTVLAYGTMLLS